MNRPPLGDGWRRWDFDKGSWNWIRLADGLEIFPVAVPRGRWMAVWPDGARAGVFGHEYDGWEQAERRWPVEPARIRVALLVGPSALREDAARSRARGETVGYALGLEALADDLDARACPRDVEGVAGTSARRYPGVGGSHG